MLANGYSRGIRPQSFRADRRLRLVWLPRIARGFVRPAGLCLGLDQVSSSRGLPGRPLEQPADGFLRPGATGGRRAAAWRRGPSRRRQSQRLRLHAGAPGRRWQAGRAARLATVKGLSARAAETVVAARGKPGHSRSYGDFVGTDSPHDRGSLPIWRPPMRSARSVSTRRPALWMSLAATSQEPLFAGLRDDETPPPLPRLSPAEDVVH